MVGGISLIWAIPIDKNLPHRSAQGIDYCTKKIVGQLSETWGLCSLIAMAFASLAPTRMGK